MADFTEKHYSIDPGAGKKMDGCPYSIFEDGHDVQEYIIPPKGYVFSGFRFDPNASNQVYDGKLIAEYEKEPFNEKLKSNLWKLILALAIVAVIAIIVVLAAGVFKDPKPNRPPKTQPTVVKPEPDTSEPETPVVDTTSIETPAEPQAEVAPEVTEEPVAEPQQTVADTPNEQFKQEFWALIHQRTIMMDPYHDLFFNNKGQASGEEYDYLRFTILQNTTAFKEWSGKLRKVPATELESISTIDDLKNKLNAIE